MFQHLNIKNRQHLVYVVLLLTFLDKNRLKNRLYLEIGKLCSHQLTAVHSAPLLFLTVSWVVFISLNLSESCYNKECNIIGFEQSFKMELIWKWNISLWVDRAEDWIKA